jgi:hypothetical protein
MSASEKREAITAIRQLQREIEARTLSGDFQSESDIFELDRRLMEAELRWPRSTLPLYFERYRTAWIAGAVLLSAGFFALALGAGAGVAAVPAVLGVLLILGPLAAWHQSRPRAKGSA